METHFLYHSEELPRARAAQKRTGRAMALAAGLGLLLCVVLCCCATRRNLGLVLPLTVGASTLAGWIVIYLSHSRYEGARARVKHLALMLSGPRERFSGRFAQQEGVWRVKRGISIRKVMLQEDLHETMLTVAADKAPLLPERFTGSVETVYDCIVAYEEGDA